MHFTPGAIGCFIFLSAWLSGYHFGYAHGSKNRNCTLDGEETY
jgi:hypothetical protein